jgi:uncharacterized DUF497 family protein
MNDEDFEWDNAKAVLNWRNHAITLEMARPAFSDAFAVEWVDTRHGDTAERFNMLAMVESRLLHVTYTVRNDRIRIISARQAEPHERRRHHIENAA